MGGKSFYILEASVAPGGARKSNYHVFNNLSEIKGALMEELTDLYLLLWYGEALYLYIIENGKLTDKIDLHPYITIQREGYTAQFIESIKGVDYRHDRTDEILFDENEQRQLSELNKELRTGQDLVNELPLEFIDKILARVKVGYYDTWRSKESFHKKYQVAIANAIRVLRTLDREVTFVYDIYYKDDPNYDSDSDSDEGDEHGDDLFSHSYDISERSDDKAYWQLRRDDGKYTYTFKINYPVITELKNNILQPDDEEFEEGDGVECPQSWDKFNPNVSPHSAWLEGLRKANTDNSKGCSDLHYGENNLD